MSSDNVKSVEMDPAHSFLKQIDTKREVLKGLSDELDVLNEIPYDGDDIAQIDRMKEVATLIRKISSTQADIYALQEKRLSLDETEESDYETIKETTFLKMPSPRYAELDFLDYFKDRLEQLSEDLSELVIDDANEDTSAKVDALCEQRRKVQCEIDACERRLRRLKSRTAIRFMKKNAGLLAFVGVSLLGLALVKPKAKPKAEAKDTPKE